MDNVVELLQGVQKASEKLETLEQEYDGRHKGSIYQKRRGLYIGTMRTYLRRLKQAFTGPVIFRITGTMDGKKFRITTVNVPSPQTEKILSLITKKTVIITDCKVEEVGEIEYLE